MILIRGFSMITDKCYFPGIPPKPTWRQRQKKRLAHWWRRTRSRIACKVLGIKQFEVKMEGTIKSWDSNIQGLCLTLDGDIDLMGSDAKFTHNEGTVTIESLNVTTGNTLTIHPSAGTTRIGEVDEVVFIM